MYLVKLSISQDAAAHRETLNAELMDTLSNFSPVFSKVPTDAIRCALAYSLRPYRSFTQYRGSEEIICKAIASSPSKVERGKLHIEIHVQERRPDKVEYTAKVCTITWDAEYGLSYRNGADAHHYRALIAAIHPGGLRELGEDLLFDQDLRRLFSQLTEPYTLKFWSGGMYVCLTDDSYQKVKAIADTLSNRATGSLRLQTITIDNSTENRASVASELGESVFSKAFNDLTHRAQKAGANTERLEDEYAKLLDKLTEVQEWLDCPIPCDEAQEEFELALSSLYEVTA